MFASRLYDSRHPRLVATGAACTGVSIADVPQGTPSAAQNGLVIQTCKNCGAINQASAEKCCYCESRLTPSGEIVGVAAPTRASATASAPSPALDQEWRREVTQCVRSYRSRHEHAAVADSQSALPFEKQTDEGSELNPTSDLTDDTADFVSPATLDDDQYEDPLQSTLAAAAARISMEEPDPSSNLFSPPKRISPSEPLFIEVSRPPEEETSPELQRSLTAAAPAESALLPVADISARRRAGLADAVCLALALAGIYGLFALFGGRLALAKMDALVCVGILALLYVQYFTLFTVMGGATPGMMLTGLRLVSFDGAAPQPKQLAWRSFGYLVSGGTALMGFLWTLWDEDHLSWHDRISQTYITSAEAILATDAHTRPISAPPA